MLIEISVATAVLIFAILSFFIIRALVSLQCSLTHINTLVIDLQDKTKKLDSTVKTIANLGDICEDKSERLKNVYLEHQKEELSSRGECTRDCAEWIVLSLKLGEKLFKGGKYGRS